MDELELIAAILTVAVRQNYPPLDVRSGAHPNWTVVEQYEQIYDRLLTRRTERMLEPETQRR